jgi:DedD protein
MAFFKFRIPGLGSSGGGEGQATAPASIEAVRKQARFRLIGSAVLVLVAVVVFPLVFDTQPRPVSVDTPIIVPDRNSAPQLSAASWPAGHRPVPEQPMAERAPQRAVSQSSVPSEPLTQQELEALKSASATVQSQASQARQVTASSASAAKPATPPKAPSTSSEADKPRPHHDAAKSPAKTETGERHVVQVGAYTDPEKVREVRRKLEQAGFKTYAQAIDGKDGKRVVRVRVGPFDKKSEAEKVAARVRKLELPVSLLELSAP